MKRYVLTILSTFSCLAYDIERCYFVLKICMFSILKILDYVLFMGEKNGKKRISSDLWELFSAWYIIQTIVYWELPEMTSPRTTCTRVYCTSKLTALRLIERLQRDSRVDGTVLGRGHPRSEPHTELSHDEGSLHYPSQYHFLGIKGLGEIIFTLALKR